MSLEVSCIDMCRACMTDHGVLLPMYDDKVISSKNLPYKLEVLTSIQIGRFDGLPNKLCAKCAYRTNTLYEFKQQVQESDKKLRLMFGNQINETLEGDEGNDEKSIMETNDESFKLTSLNDWDSVNVTESLPIGVINEPENNQQVEIDVLLLNQNDERRKGYKPCVSSTPSLQKAGMKQIAMHPTKAKIPKEISKILESEQVKYMVTYIPESAIIEPTTKSTVENILTSNSDQGNIFVPIVEILSGQENIGQIFGDMYISNNTEYKVAEKIEMTCKKSVEDDYVQHEDEVNHESNSEAKEPCKVQESDESNSDDSKINVMGSMNDMITRIKEVKEGGTVEYQCTLCLQNYDELSGVLLHIIDKHIPSSGPFFCVVCEKDCKSRRDLRMHAKTHTGRFPYSCFICNKAYTTKRYLKRHMVCHVEFPRHRCPKCGIRFKAKSELESHVSTHTEGAPYACSQCPRMFNHKGNYKRHLINHLDPQGLHLPKYPCKICGKRFLNNRTLETHTRVHTGEKPFCCEMCGKSFSQQGNLLNHARIHTNPRSYECETCGKRFNQHATLKDHRLLHTGEKPHVCSECGDAFTFGAALRRHLWSHKDDKPFNCENCGARFVGKYDLRRHMQVHTDRPKAKRKRNTMSKAKGSTQKKQYVEVIESPLKEEIFAVTDKTDLGTVLMEQVLLPQDVTQEAVHKVQSEKENVDALFSLIQYD